MSCTCLWDGCSSTARIRQPSIAPLSIAYAFYVPTNLVLFWFFQTGPTPMSVPGIVAYLAVALGGAIGTALYIGYHRDRLLD